MSFVSFSFRAVLVPDDVNPSKYIDPGPIAPAIMKWIKTYVDRLDTDTIVGFTIKYDSDANRFKSSFVVHGASEKPDTQLIVDDIVEHTRFAEEKFKLDGRLYSVVCNDIVVE